MNGGGGWGVFNAILGWQNSATYGSVLSYNVYWIVVILAFFAMRFKEVKGHWPLMKAKKEYNDDKDQSTTNSRSSSDVDNGMFVDKEEAGVVERPLPAREISA